MVKCSEVGTSFSVIVDFQKIASHFQTVGMLHGLVLLMKGRDNLRRFLELESPGLTKRVLGILKGHPMRLV